MPLPIMKAAEAYFLLAEAKLRWDIGSESVKNLYENGIRGTVVSLNPTGEVTPTVWFGRQATGKTDTQDVYKRQVFAVPACSA